MPLGRLIRRGAHAARSEAGARAVRDAVVPGGADDGDIGLHLVELLGRLSASGTLQNVVGPRYAGPSAYRSTAAKTIASVAVQMDLGSDRCRKTHHGLSDAEALSFDCYGTLIDWEAGIAAVLAPWARDAWDRHRRRGAARAIRECGGPQEERDTCVRSTRTSSLRRCESSGKPSASRSAQTESERLAASVPQTGRRSRIRKRAGGARDALQAGHSLQHRSARPSRASNARLGVRFDAIVTAQDVGSYKPSPRNFEALLADGARTGGRATAGCCMSRRACSTTTFPRRDSGCRPCGSTGVASAADGGRRLRRNRGGRRIGRSRRWPLSRPPVSRRTTTEGCRLTAGIPCRCRWTRGAVRLRTSASSPGRSATADPGARCP